MVLFPKQDCHSKGKATTTLGLGNTVVTVTNKQKLLYMSYSLYQLNLYQREMYLDDPKDLQPGLLQSYNWPVLDLY